MAAPTWLLGRTIKLRLRMCCQEATYHATTSTIQGFYSRMQHMCRHHIPTDMFYRTYQSLYCLRYLRSDVHSRCTARKSFRFAPETCARRYSRAIGGGVWIVLSA